MSWPDYHPEMDGAKPSGRMLEPALFDAKVLGPWRERLRRPPVLGMPITLQESTVEWRPAYFPDRFDLAMVQQRIAEHQVACGQALIAGLLAGCLARGIEPELETSAKELVMANDSVGGLVVERTGEPAERSRSRPRRWCSRRAASNGTPRFELVSSPALSPIPTAHRSTTATGC